MEKGKRICKTLKDIRKRIADANDMPYNIEECSHEGDCSGSCPKCEQEMQYLAESIETAEKEGKSVNVDGLVNDENLCKMVSIDGDEENGYVVVDSTGGDMRLEDGEIVEVSDDMSPMTPGIITFDYEDWLNALVVDSDNGEIKDIVDDDENDSADAPKDVK
jgi:hypothetical protein